MRKRILLLDETDPIDSNASQKGYAPRQVTRAGKSPLQVHFNAWRANPKKRDNRNADRLLDRAVLPATAKPRTAYKLPPISRMPSLQILWTSEFNGALSSEQETTGAALGLRISSAAGCGLPQRCISVSSRSSMYWQCCSPPVPQRQELCVHTHHVTVHANAHVIFACICVTGGGHAPTYRTSPRPVGLLWKARRRGTLYCFTFDYTMQTTHTARPSTLRFNRPVSQVWQVSSNE